MLSSLFDVYNELIHFCIVNQPVILWTVSFATISSIKRDKQRFQGNPYRILDHVVVRMRYQSVAKLVEKPRDLSKFFNSVHRLCFVKLVIIQNSERKIENKFTANRRSCVRYSIFTVIICNWSDEQLTLCNDSLNQLKVREGAPGQVLCY